MPEIAEKKIEIPVDVMIKVSGRTIAVKGPKGELVKKFSDPRYDSFITIKNENGFIVITCASKRKKAKALFGTVSSGVRKMIVGVTKGYTYTMRIFSVHFPMNITVKDNIIQIKNFLGEKTLRYAKIHGNVKVKIDKDSLLVSGVDNEDVGQTCGNIEKAVKISKKDHRIFQDGIYLQNKSSGM